MSDAREYEYGSYGEAGSHAAVLFHEGHDVWIRPQHRTDPVTHTVWVVTVR